MLESFRWGLEGLLHSATQKGCNNHELVTEHCRNGCNLQFLFRILWYANCFQNWLSAFGNLVRRSQNSFPQDLKKAEWPIFLGLSRSQLVSPSRSCVLTLFPPYWDARRDSCSESYRFGKKSQTFFSGQQKSSSKKTRTEVSSCFLWGR